MKKLAIVFDSFCGKNKNEIKKEKDIFLIPLQIEIDEINKKVGISKKEDIEITKLIARGGKTRTSMPSTGDILDVFEESSKLYENVIYLPLSSAISGTAKVAMGLAQDFKNIWVIETHLLGKAFFEIGKHLIKMANKKNISIEKIKKMLNEYVKNDLSQVFVIPKTVSGLIKSGRVNKMTLNILGKLNMIPVISYEWDNKKLHSRGIKKSSKKAIEFTILKIEAFIKNRKDFRYLITTTPGHEIKNIAEKLLKDKNYEYTIENASPIIYSVCRENTISISAFKKIKN